MKRFFILLLSLTLLLFSGCGASLPPENAPSAPPSSDIPSEDVQETQYSTYAVATSSLRIRTKPNTSSNVVGLLDKNDALLILGEENGFYKSVFKQKTVYVSKNYCTIMQIEKGSDKVEKATELGSTLLGYPYVWGSQRYHWGNGKLNTNFVMGEFDCSAFVQYIYYHSNGALLDLTTREQVDNGKPISDSELSRGDLMFFTNESRKNKTGRERIGHVAIYLGNNYILHTASDHAVIEPISSLRWSYYICSRRIV